MPSEETGGWAREGGGGSSSGASGVLFPLAHRAPTSPVPAIPRSRSGTPRRSSWRPRKISCSFSKCSEEAAEVAMAQAAFEQRAPKFWAQGPFLLRRQPPSPAGITATAATVAQDEALPGPRLGPPGPERPPPRMPSLTARRAPKPDRKLVWLRCPGDS